MNGETGFRERQAQLYQDALAAGAPPAIKCLHPASWYFYGYDRPEAPTLEELEAEIEAEAYRQAQVEKRNREERFKARHLRVVR